MYKWPTCDKKSLPMCKDFPKPPDPIDIIKEEPQLPGGAIYYRCKQGGKTSSLGFKIEVSMRIFGFVLVLFLL